MTPFFFQFSPILNGNFLCLFQHCIFQVNDLFSRFTGQEIWRTWASGWIISRTLSKPELICLDNEIWELWSWWDLDEIGTLSWWCNGLSLLRNIGGWLKLLCMNIGDGCESLRARRYIAIGWMSPTHKTCPCFNIWKLNMLAYMEKRTMEIWLLKVFWWEGHPG